ncbi:hypothetical protein C0Z10_11165 [Acidipropionibacterium jensenii]|uniref:Uncharacterized protein n=1 Tax=Acidipropionibacterium jensenii TaxID=1749 RepID=A0A3T0S1I5_9ACTN|nr:hypothetical protein [Acidipropionibacterium jensenii]AZZ40219.1 hypothetical protein C0Z10_11165 [Acidipropionibacterium jensenii]
MPEARIITTNRAGIIWSGITWCSLLLVIPAGIAGMMMQTLLPANLGYPQIDATGVPRWLSLTVLATEIAVFAVPAIVCTLCNRKASRMGHPVNGAVAAGWGVFGLVAVIGVLLWFFG